MASSVYNHNFENVQNILGSIVFDEEEGIKASSGELENQQKFVDIMTQVLKLCQQFVSSINMDKSDIIHRIIINYKSFSYIISYDCKKKLVCIVKTGKID